MLSWRVLNPPIPSSKLLKPLEKVRGFGRRGSNTPQGHSRQAKRFICLTLGAGPHASHVSILQQPDEKVINWFSFFSQYAVLQSDLQSAPPLAVQGPGIY
jgi:hypothetical protein